MSARLGVWPLALVWASAGRVSKWEARLEVLEATTEFSVEDHYKLKYIIEQLGRISEQLDNLTE